MTSNAEIKHNRIERGLDANQQPPGKPPLKQGGWIGGNNEESKNQSPAAIGQPSRKSMSLFVSDSASASFSKTALDQKQS